jgi:O-antigen/teichoic acid export membrane protein
MSTGQRIIKNSIFLTTSQVFSKFFNLGLILVLTRMLGKDGFGLYSYSFAYVSLFLVFTHLGIINLQVREIAKFKNNAADILGTTFPAILYLSFGFMVLVNLIPFIMDWDYSERSITMVFSLYFIFDTFGHYFLGVIRAFERMEYQAIINVLERVFILVTALIAWYFNLSLLHVVTLFTIVLALKALISFIIVNKKFVCISPQFSSSRIISILKDAYPFALVGLFATVSARIDTVMLGGMQSIDSVAVYNAARKIIESLAFLPESIYYSVFPAISILYLNQKTKFITTFQKTIILMVMIAIPIVSGIFILAPRIIDLLFESEFSGASIALRWLSIALAIMFIRHSFAVVLNAVGKQHLLAAIFGISMIVNIGLNFLLIPIYGILGASIVAIVSEFTVLIISFPFLLKYIHFTGSKSSLFRLTIVGIIITVIIYLIQTWNLLLIGIVIVFIYIILILLFRIVSSNELKDISRIFSN